MADSGAQKLYFDPDLHPEETLKTFDEFVQDYELRYAASYPDPPKVSMDAAIQRWKLQHANHENANPSMAQFDEIKAAWQSKDKVAKLLGLYSSRRLFTDWKVAEPTEATRNMGTVCYQDESIL